MPTLSLRRKILIGVAAIIVTGLTIIGMVHSGNERASSPRVSQKTVAMTLDETDRASSIPKYMPKANGSQTIQMCPDPSAPVPDQAPSNLPNLNPGQSSAPVPNPHLGLAMNSMESLERSRKLMRSGTLHMEVQNFDATLRSLEQILSPQGGYIADIKCERNKNQSVSGSITLRMPVGNYYGTLHQLRALGKVHKEAIYTQDITKSYADLESRLRNKRQTEARIRELLRTRNGNLEELLRTEQELERIMGEIELMEGEKRYYDSVTAMSSLTLELNEPALLPPAPAKEKVYHRIMRAFHETGDNLTQAGLAFLLFLIYAGPFLLVPLALSWSLWILFKRVWNGAPLESVPDSKATSHQPLDL